MSLEVKSSQHQTDRLVLPNGITLIVTENPAADLIAGRWFFQDAGSLREKRSHAGLVHLVASVMTKGTRNLNALEIAEQIESIGASLGADGSTDYFGLSLKTVTADFVPMLELLAEIIRFPTFPVSEVELERKITIQSIRSQKEQSFSVAFSQLRDSIYDHHPYGVSILGTEESVASLTSEDLQEFHQTYFRPDKLIISLAGNISTAKAQELITSVFGDWEIPQEKNSATRSIPLTTQPTEETIIQDTQQSIVMLGYKGVSINDPAYVVLKLISTYLGNGLSSRLFVELREKRGLAYDVSAFFPTRLDIAPFVVYMGTAPTNTQIALDGLSSEVTRLSTTKLTDAELQNAKNKFLGQYALGKQTNGEIAQTYGWYEALGLGIDFDRELPEKIAQITAEQIQQVAQTYLQNPYISIVKPEDIKLEQEV